MKEILDDLDTKLRKFIELKKQVKPMLEKIDELAELFKEMGSFSTGKFVCSVEDRTRTAMISLEKAIELHGRTAVEALDLIKTSQFKIVHVSKKETKVLDLMTDE